MSATLRHVRKWRCSNLASAWYEWVGSDSNPADGLSRDGAHDKWTLEQGWHLTEFPPSAFTAAGAGGVHPSPRHHADHWIGA